MKHDLEIVKEALSQEIETYWRNQVSLFKKMNMGKMFAQIGRHDVFD